MLFVYNFLTTAAMLMTGLHFFPTFNALLSLSRRHCSYHGTLLLLNCPLCVVGPTVNCSDKFDVFHCLTQYACYDPQICTCYITFRQFYLYVQARLPYSFEKQLCKGHSNKYFFMASYYNRSTSKNKFHGRPIEIYLKL